MEMLFILVAVVAAVLACVVLTASFGRTRRPPLRTQREEDLADGDEEAFLDSLVPARASPIERGGAVLDLVPIEPGARRGEAGRDDEADEEPDPERVRRTDPRDR